MDVRMSLDKFEKNIIPLTSNKDSLKTLKKSNVINLLMEDEIPKSITNGTRKGNEALLIVTNIRIIFIFKSTFLRKSEITEIPLETITSCRIKNGILFSDFFISTAKEEFFINNVQKKPLKLSEN